MSICISDFIEALQLTNQAKAKFPTSLSDVYARGRRLIVESILNGVTAMRAHVEVDNIVGLECLGVALNLKEEFENRCQVQIAVFAQDPLFESDLAESPGINFTLLSDAARTPGVSAVGSAPYVERTLAQSKQNISSVLQLAQRFGLLVDFHLDYSLDPSTPPLIYHLLDLVHAQEVVPKMITIGHGTRYSLFSATEWVGLQEKVGTLPISFVALPQSDLYMMGRSRDPSRLAPRGTLPVPFIASLGLNIALSVNNIGNAFTPQGAPDPLALCPLGVAIYQDATAEACRTLLVRHLISKHPPRSLLTR
ncbi:Metallo-dependent hydrolase [Multifurca ochricompacta]|uniref:Metallo-dependent hydrolase n=1 Tax=Multifurca ochricompacta TaxID=376703 RepID=A0AAD4QQB0_9AGAM|nr:Metallo-dependent hydrolase [Multifurca ochricompacta]